VGVCYQVSLERDVMGEFGTDVMLLYGASVEVVWHKSFDFLTKVVVWLKCYVHSLSVMRGIKNKSGFKRKHTSAESGNSNFVMKGYRPL
jgi:hypothetical protein